MEKKVYKNKLEQEKAERKVVKQCPNDGLQIRH